jgi:hypothetical protein
VFNTEGCSMSEKTRIDKVVRIGRGEHGNVYCAIKFDGKRLSITGVEGPLRNGDAKGSCGQIVMHEWSITEYAPGWDAGLMQKFREVWGRWHLNDMKAGSPAQEKYLREHPVVFAYPESHYTKACVALTVAGLHPDPGYLHDGKPYLYGHRWLHEDVPDEVLAWLLLLPDTDITPAWV